MSKSVIYVTDTLHINQIKKNHLQFAISNDPNQTLIRICMVLTFYIKTKPVHIQDSSPDSASHKNFNVKL